MSDKPRWKQLDCYYTNKDCAKHCYGVAVKKLEEFTGRGADDVVFYEPAAGEGAFFNLFPKDRRIGIDLDPKGEDIIQDNFLTREIPDKDKVYFGITNPPYGYRLKIARDFFNRLALFCDAICFIAPPSFCRYQSANSLVKTHRLIYEEVLPDKSFHTPDGKSYSIPTSLSIWVKTTSVPPISKPKRTHPDFTITQYHNKRRVESVFDEPFDLAIVGTTYGDSIEIKYHKDECDRSKVWNIIRCKNNEVKDRLLSIDWNSHFTISSSRICSSMHKIVEAYTNKYGDGSYLPQKAPKLRSKAFKC